MGSRAQARPARPYQGSHGLRQNPGGQKFNSYVTLASYFTFLKLIFSSVILGGLLNLTKTQVSVCKIQIMGLGLPTL